MDMDMYPAAAAEKSPEKAPEKSDDSEAETSLLPKSLFGGDCKVGDTYKVRVVAIHGDELEVEPAGEESDKKDSEDDMANPVDRMME